MSIDLWLGNQDVAWKRYVVLADLRLRAMD
jgi:hypothetical protein